MITIKLRNPYQYDDYCKSQWQSLPTWKKVADMVIEAISDWCHDLKLRWKLPI